MIPALVNAQPFFDDSMNDVPIDGELSFLIAAVQDMALKK
jgi:hypothetical protein